MAEPNTIRRPAKPVPTFIGPVQEAAASQWHFPFYQPTANATTPLWFAQPTKSKASALRNMLAKQPLTFPVSQALLDAIKASIAEANPDTHTTQDIEDADV